VKRSLFLLALLSCSTSGPITRAPTPGQPSLRVVTYNLNYGLAEDPLTLFALARHEADVVFLQETNEAWREKIEGRLSEVYPYRAFHDAGAAGGMAILAKAPIRNVEILPPESWFAAMHAVVETPLGPIEVLNVHLRPPLSESGSVISGYFSTPAVREREIRTFLASLAGDHPLLIAGDFNEGPGGRALEVLEARGLRSVLPELSPDATTWRWNTSVGEITSTLDHVVHDERLVALDARAFVEGRSDHLPVMVTFERR
jgi:endonuclease/exonuclease/phosphatase (EEP) superfamily protein YafD